EGSIAQDRLLANLSGSFGLIAALLVSMGLYGVTSYAVSHRTPEIGIRIALGAENRHVLRMVIGEAVALAASGLLVGLAAAIAVGRSVASLLFGITGADPLILAATPLLVLLISLLSAWLPARRAANVDPMTALRYE